jgi:hypothetical protein
MSTFLTLTTAKQHAGIPASDVSRDDDLQLKLDAAEAAVLDYIKTQAPDPSPLILIAMLMTFQEFNRFRGDDANGAGPSQTAGDLSPVVTNLLRRLRDPAIA